MFSGVLDPSFVSSLVAMVVMAAVYMSYRPLMSRTQETWLRRIYTGIVIIAVVLILRSFYWDILQGFLPRESWIRVRSFLGNQTASAFFNMGTAIGGVILLQARVMLIRGEDKEGHAHEGWKWWNVWRRK